MRTINTKNNVATSSSFNNPVANKIHLFGDQYPCWCVDLETAEDKSNYKWKVVCIEDGKKDEYSFKISSVGDVNDAEFWQQALGKDFALKLLSLFKYGGSQAVIEWTKQGCVL